MRYRIEGLAVWIAAGLATIAGTCLGEWEYQYSDTFSTSALATDSFDHSPLWPEGTYPPNQPYLSLVSSVPEPPAAGFFGVKGVAARLSYCFPIGPAVHPRHIKGEIQFDILAPEAGTIPDSSIELSLSVSGDGLSWSNPEILSPGHHTIRLASNEGTCYVLFTGTCGILDNLRVELESEGKTLRVPEDFSTIQKAIDAAVAGQEVVVSPGTYWGDGNWNLELRGKPITIRSEKGPELTILDCQGPYQGPGKLPNRGFYIHEGEGSGTVIQGFTIQNGVIPGFSNLYETQPYIPGPTNTVGGGIYCEYAGPTIADCVIRDSAAEFGGGIGCVSGSPVIVNCHITGCKAGGQSNSKSGGFGGGIALLHSSDATIRQCSILGNHGYYSGYGGGIYVRVSVARILDCQIQFNDADGYLSGGGLAVGGPNSKVSVQNSVIASNIAYQGAGILVDGRHENQLGGGVEGPICEALITHCTVTDNKMAATASQKPVGGIWAQKTDIRVRNSILYGNGGQEVLITEAVSTTPITYSDIKGGFAGSGNINVAPLFAPRGGGESQDYHLQSSVGRFDPKTGQWVIDPKHSPCIDAGDLRDSYVLEPEPNGHRVNLGAYGGTPQASKGLGNLVYHVDGTSGNDSYDGLSRETAFKSIMKGINTGQNGDTILVWPGVYTGPVNFLGKAIILTSAADAAILTAPGDYAVSFYTAEGPGSELKNFVIRGCLAGVFITNSSPTLTNLTIVKNTNGILAYEDSQPSIRNCIMWDNSGKDLFGCKAFYCCMEDEDAEVNGIGNIHQNPLFVDTAKGDYHLKSQRGRFWPGTGISEPTAAGIWVLDDVSSPCIDAGDPAVRPARERMPNGGRLNQGANGGTAFASMSEWPLSHDSNRDGRVDLADFAGLAEAWLRQLAWVEPDMKIQIVKPTNGDLISLGQGRFEVTATVSGTGASIEGIEFYVDGILTCLDYNGNNGWICTPNLRTIGTHRICAWAVDSNGGGYEGDCIEVRAVE